MSKFFSDFFKHDNVYVPLSLKAALDEDSRAARSHKQMLKNEQKASDKLAARMASKVGQLNWPPKPHGAAIQIFNRHLVESYLGYFESACTGDEDRQRVKALCKLLFDSGEHRPLCTPNALWELQLDDLETQFPVFAEVVAYVRGAISISMLEKSAPILLPILLVGNPGVGKTYFTSRLAKLLNAPFSTIQANTMQSNSTLSGSSSFWSNAVPGKIFKSLVYGSYGNPTILLDEIDKIGTGLQYDPMASLFQILDFDSAKLFCDLCYEWLPIDASRVVYICTANTASLPEPILSRMRVFYIPDLSGHQCRQVIYQIFNDLKKRLPEAIWNMSLDDDTIQCLIALPARTVRNTLMEAVGRAVIRGDKNWVLPEDIALSIQHRKKIGFLS